MMTGYCLVFILSHCGSFRCGSADACNCEELPSQINIITKKNRKLKFKDCGDESKQQPREEIRH